MLSLLVEVIWPVDLLLHIFSCIKSVCVIFGGSELKERSGSWRISRDKYIIWLYITRKKAKELSITGAHDWNHVWTKIYKKKRYEEVKMTMTDFNNKVLNDYSVDMIIWIVGINGRIYAWNPSKRNIILLEIKKVRAIRWIYLHFAPLRFL